MSILVTALSLLAVIVAVAAYPTKDDDSFYYGRLHDLSNFNKETRNLDGIDGRSAVAALPLMTKADQDLSADKGSQTKYRFGALSGSHLDGIGGGHLVRDLETDLEQGGGNLLRDLDLLRNRADLLSRASRDQGENDKKQGMAYHYMDPLLGNTIGLAKRFRPYETLRFGNIPNKREWDEIDRSSFGSFAKKNFDEIDRSGFGSFVKKNFDEIDRSGFGSFVKRSVPQSAPEVPQN